MEMQIGTFPGARMKNRGFAYFYCLHLCVVRTMHLSVDASQAINNNNRLIIVFFIIILSIIDTPSPEYPSKVILLLALFIIT